jgi:hypothetical protein
MIKTSMGTGLYQDIYGKSRLSENWDGFVSLYQDIDAYQLHPGYGMFAFMLCNCQ